MTFTLGEILEGIRDLSPEEALEYLKKNKSPALWKILGETLHPEDFDRQVLDITWKPSIKPMGYADNTLYFELKRFYIFKKDSIVPLERKKVILMQILETLHKIESGIYLSILSGTFYNRFSNISPEVIKELITKS